MADGFHPNHRSAADSSTAPANIEAEQALLGALLYDNQAATCIGHYLQPRHFHEPFHERVFGQILEMIGRGERAEVILVGQRFAQDPSFLDFGGLAYFADLVDRAPPAANAPDYAKAIFDTALRRDLLAICERAARSAVTENDRPVFDIVSDLRSDIEATERDAAPDDVSMVDAPRAAALAIANMQDLAAHGRTRGLHTGLRCVDRRLNGLAPGAMVVIGGRPGMGKTALARNIAHGAAVRNPNRLFAFFGIEMCPEEMMQRELSALTHEAGEGIEYRAMASGSLTPFDFQSLAAAEQRVPPNLILDDCPSLSTDDVRRKVWSLGRRGNVGAVFIDYLQLMRRPAANGRNEASVVSEMTHALKLIARQAGITVVLLSQLNRSVESRDDKKPQLNDLRESGGIEQDADAVLFPFREYYYALKAEPKASETTKHLDWEVQCQDLRRRLDVICAKQRQGPEGTDRQNYWAEFDFIEDHHE